MSTNPKRYGAPAGAGNSVAIGGLGVDYKLSGNETGGAFAIVEHPLRIGALAGPLHTHTREDEVSLVLEGEVGVQIGDDVFTAPIGTYVVKPRGIPHTFWNAGSTPARIQEIISPAGFEEYFREVAEALAPGGPPDLAKLMDVASRYGLILHMERLGEVMETHGVSFEGR